MSQRTDAMLSPPTTPVVPRRLFLRWGLWGATLALGGQLTVGLAGFAWPKRLHSRDWYGIAGRAEDFQVGDVLSVSAGRFFVSRVPEGFLALSDLCTHLNCGIDWRPGEPSMDQLASQGRFNCPCHGAIFDRYGQIITGPAPRPLNVFPLWIKQGQLWVSNNRGWLRQRESATERVVPYDGPVAT